MSNIYNEKYEYVLKELKNVMHPLCHNLYCIYRPILVDNYLMSKPRLIRYSKKICDLCKKNNTSYNYFRVCSNCATYEYDIEYNYYHDTCNIIINNLDNKMN